MAKRTRVSHLTFAHALARMAIGPFSADDLQAATGLHRTTIYRLIKSLSGVGVVRPAGRRQDARGRENIQLHQLAIDSAKKQQSVDVPTFCGTIKL